MLTNFYDFDRNGHLISFDPTRTIVPFPDLQSKRKLPQRQKVDPSSLKLNDARDALLTDFGKATLDDRYLLDGENYQQMFARVACAYADDLEHAQRLYDYISQLWFMPSTPILSNGGAKRGLPISCFLNTVADSLDGIVSTWNENVLLASNGGGVGTYWGFVRGIGEPVGRAGKTSGIIPFLFSIRTIVLIFLLFKKIKTNLH